MPTSFVRLSNIYTQRRKREKVKREKEEKEKEGKNDK